MGQVRLSYSNCPFHDINTLCAFVTFVNILDMEGMNLFLVLEAYECSYATLYMPYDMFGPYVMSYLCCVLMC